GSVTLPGYMDTLFVRPAYSGLISGKILIKNNKVQALIGGSSGFGGNFIAAEKPVENNGGADQAHLLTVYDDIEFRYPSGHSSTLQAVISSLEYPIWLGRPKYLEPVGDDISPKMLEYINSSLPAGQDVRIHHPNYLNDNAVSVINVVKNADIYVSFIGENAEYTSTLAYYTYPTNKPPTSLNKIESATVIFPNAS